MSRELTYDVHGLGLRNSRGQSINTIIIQDHSYGHKYPGGIGNQSSHFNVRPETNVRNGGVMGIQDHYYFTSKYNFDR